MSVDRVLVCIVEAFGNAFSCLYGVPELKHNIRGLGISTVKQVYFTAKTK